MFERLSEIIICLKKHGFAIKKMKFVYPKTNAKEALLILIEAKKNGNESMKVEQPLYIYQEDGEYTNEVKQIFHFQEK